MDPFGYVGPITIRMKAAAGGAFSFFGADFSPSVSAGYMDAGIAGQLVGGGLVAGNIGPGWVNLEWVDFYVGADLFMDPSGAFAADLGMSIDNINATAVPLPAAVWLFGPALAGLAGVGRSRRRVVSL